MKTSAKYRKNFSAIKKATKGLSIALLMFLNADTFGQDTLVMKDNSKIAAKVIEISNTEIKMFDNSNRPDYITSTSSVSQIKYTSGTVDTFNAEATSNVDQLTELKESEGRNVCDDRSVRGPEMQEPLSLFNNVYISNPVRSVARNNGLQYLGVAVVSFLTEVGYNCTVSLLR